jgi:hypothetical protein
MLSPELTSVDEFSVQPCFNGIILALGVASYQISNTEMRPRIAASFKAESIEIIRGTINGLPSFHIWRGKWDSQC